MIAAFTRVEHDQFLHATASYTRTIEPLLKIYKINFALYSVVEFISEELIFIFKLVFHISELGK